MYYSMLLVYGFIPIILICIGVIALAMMLRPKMLCKNNKKSVTFSVLVTSLQPFELVGLTGSIAALGNWSPDKFLKLTAAGDDVWDVTVKTADIFDDKISYRYFVYVRQTDGYFQIRSWETHLNPRTICLNQLPAKRIDAFGISEGEINVHRGWLTHENIVQFKFFDNPFDLVEKNNASIYLKLIPVCACSGKTIRNPGTAHIEVFQLDCDESKLRPQKNVGVQLFANSVTMFHATVANIEKVKFKFKILFATNFSLGGTFSVLPMTLLGTDGFQEVKISSPKGKTIGTVRFPYIVIKPFSSRKFNFRNAFAYYWSDKWTGLEYGHRGAGETFNEYGTNTDVTENTMASFKLAVDSKVDGIEVDVLLTKDFVPVIFHDFNISTFQGPGVPNDPSDLCQIPICTLTYEELKKIAWYKTVGDQIFRVPAHDDEACPDCGIFPTLSDFLRQIPQHIGLNLEVKYPQIQINGEMEGLQDIDKNCYVDIILDELIKDSGTRNILLTSFEADVTIMLRFKQNMFPVAFLSTGETTKWLAALDPRCSNARKAITCAQAFELIGISTLVEECLDSQKVLLKAFALKQIVILWGDEVDNTKIIEKFKNYGVTGLIVDCVDKNIPKEKKCIKFRNPDTSKLYRNRAN